MKCIKCGKELKNDVCLACYQFDKSKYTIIDSSVILVSVEKLNGLEAENKALKEHVERLKNCHNCRWLNSEIGGYCLNPEIAKAGCRRYLAYSSDRPDLWGEQE